MRGPRVWEVYRYYSVNSSWREAVDLTPLKASFEKGGGIRAIVPPHGKVQASKCSKGLLLAGLDLVGNDVRPEWIPVCGSELGIPSV